MRMVSNINNPFFFLSSTIKPYRAGKIVLLLDDICILKLTETQTLQTFLCLSMSIHG